MTVNSSSDQPLSLENTKKPYEKPSFRHEQVFVTTALSCGKVSEVQQQCALTTLSAS